MRRTVTIGNAEMICGSAWAASGIWYSDLATVENCRLGQVFQRDPACTMRRQMLGRAETLDPACAGIPYGRGRLSAGHDGVGLNEAGQVDRSDVGSMGDLGLGMDR